MTTIVLAHPTEQHPKFQVFAVYDAHDVHRAFGAQEFADRDEAERAASVMMITSAGWSKWARGSAEAGSPRCSNCSC